MSMGTWYVRLKMTDDSRSLRILMTTNQQ